MLENMLVPTLTFNNFIPIETLLYKANYPSGNIGIQYF